jgi:hypothetical protein
MTKFMKFETGDTVIIILHGPREKILGTLGEITSAGIVIRGIDLEYFDDWTAAIATGEPHLAMTDYFFPMWRVERVTRDEASGEVPALADHFESRTGLRLSDM